MATWVVQANLVSKERDQSVNWALQELDIPYVDVNVVPFSDDLVISYPITGKKIIPYGTTSLVKHAAKMEWEGLFTNNDFQVDSWNRHRNDMLNSDAEVMTVKEAGVQFSTRAKNELWFIRPLEDLKIFSGTVTTAEEISHWMASIDSGNFQFSEDTLIAISQPKTILAEWRWFIVDCRVIDGSMYHHNGSLYKKHETDVDVICEAQELADKWLPHETVVM